MLQLPSFPAKLHWILPNKPENVMEYNQIKSEAREWIRSYDHALNLHWDYHSIWQFLHDIPMLQKIPVSICKN